jgi:quercetin dioxygenase-like cupin family protein
MSISAPRPSRLEPVVHVVRPDEGVVGPLRILAGSEETRSLYFALEWETPPAPPGPAQGWHAHEEHDESEYVLTGEREILVDDQRWQGGPGLFVLAPRRRLHTMRTIGPQPSRWLHFFSPAGLEAFFVERERLRAQGASADAIHALGERYGIFDAARSPATESVAVSPAGTRGDGTVVAGGSTRNAYALAERAALPEEAHVHAEQEEACYVIRGELAIEAEGVAATLPARSFVLFPRGLRHRHVSAARTELLAVFSPGHQILH